MITAMRSIWDESKGLFVWVNILFTINVSSGLMAWLYPQDVTKLAALLALVVGILPGFIFVNTRRGVGYFMSIPHLIGWIPLQVYLLLRLSSDLAGPQLGASSGVVFYWAVALFVVNMVSLPFDVRDSWRWVKGQRGVLFQES